MKTYESFRKQISDFSKQPENKQLTFRVVCTNYCDTKSYYLKNGIFADGTCFNTKYAFFKDLRKLSNLHKDGIYKITELEKGERNIYNL